ncbi:MAG: methyltransferase [Deltaproteobacteria bacterium]|nr:MAG: methyltransferase [Deltaproteobacteria bacterium]
MNPKIHSKTSTNSPWKGHDALFERWSALSTLLQRTRFLWEPRPFMELVVPWEADFPAVSQWARRLSSSMVDAIELDPFVCDDVPQEFVRWRDDVASHTAIGPMPSVEWPGSRRYQLSWKIQQHKWRQVQAFCTTLLPLWPKGGEEIVDWCSGKGHLGRTLGALLELPVLGLERQAPLCRVGLSMAERQDVKGRFVTADVLQDDVSPHLNPEQVAVGLHACGVLSHSLLQKAVEHNLQAVAVVPCCHHFVGSDATEYPPLSQAGRELGMPLDDRLLRLSIADEVRSTALERRQRRKELDFRLGFDILVREATGEDRYHSMGNLPLGVGELPFADFCYKMSELLELPLPPRWNPTRTLAAGIERARLARGRALVRSLFRRPLEVWLVVERALFLAEQGWDTQVGVFCDSSLTPRNLMIVGRNLS